MCGQLFEERPAQPAAEQAPGRPVRAAEGDAIAIVSMACRFPGGADGPEALWRLLGIGQDVTSERPTTTNSSPLSPR